ncbi:NRDE family protein [uncultured Microbulbifer sp.]|uniref:NRDE family protein n=1 Tax=uncultured Microbulbifer sp. TaxID=348147 RepID=UPI002614BC37|nr:NRDE family protein [uncultured Microbulbifer sp.]
MLFAYHCHPDYPLLLIANRDEFYARETDPAGPWRGGQMIAGRDLRAGGTWAGIARGRVAAVTNIREPDRAEPGDVLSRGEIPQKFLTTYSSPEQFAQGLEGVRYRGFNALLFAQGANQPLVCAGNRHRPFAFSSGVHGISNGAPDAPWPKVEKGKAALAEMIRCVDGPINQTNFIGPALSLLRDTSPAADAGLPNTGAGLPLERALSPIFVRIVQRENLLPNDVADGDIAQGYGTRASTIIAVHRSGLTQLWEQSFTQGTRSGPLRHFSIP